MSDVNTEASAKNTRTLVGRVVSDKRAKTVTVLVERRTAHELYGKIVARSRKYHAHDEKGEFKMGDLVEIAEGRPISKTKSWVVTRLLEKANSDAFAGPRTVAGISEALALLGTADLRELVSTAPLGTASRSVPGVNLQQFWRYSRNTAKLARALAGFVHQNQIAAYTAGLLHGLGELALPTDRADLGAEGGSVFRRHALVNYFTSLQSVNHNL